MRRLSVVPAVAVVLSGCAGMEPAQTRKEFVQKNLDGVPFSMVDKYVAKRRFEDVVAALRQKTAECFNVNVTTTRSQGGMTTSKVRDEYRTTIRLVSANRAELTTQHTSKGIVYLQKIPEGGFYSRAVDIDRLTLGTTRLTYYGSSFESGKKAWAAIKDWSDGKATPCP
jgi:hypothetical protein